MYLNINIPPPKPGGYSDGSTSSSSSSCANTPKTPEILNSLISLEATPIPSSYANYHSQISAGELLSPTSSCTTSPSDETSSTQFGTPPAYGPQMSPSGGSDPGGGGSCVLGRVSGVFRGISAGTIFAPGTPSPPVPELPSPVNTVEATKTALIKEGLKHQIKSKLQKQGLEPNELLSDQKSVKEEVSDSGELTPQDEERRLRRRERNKIAATKCRNKKKEKTVILMTESESVEDQNLRLKSEIQRLTSEKMKLKKLLDDPCHVASCRHSCGRGTMSSHAPLVVITSPPDAPEHHRLQLLSSSAERVIASSSGCSEQSATDLITSLSYCSSNIPSTCEPSFTSESPSTSYISLSPSTISPLSLPSVSPPHLTTSNACLPVHTMSSYLSHTDQHSFTDESSLLSLSIPNDTSSSSLSRLPTLNILPTSEALPGSSNDFLTPKSSNLHTRKRQQPYTMSRPSRVTASYPAESSVTHHTQDLQGCRDYCYPSVTREDAQFTSNSFLYPTQSAPLLSCSDFPVTKTSTGKVRQTLTTQCRYTPYDRYNRHQQHQNVCPSTQSAGADSPLDLPSGEPYLQSPCNPFLTEASQNQIYNYSYGNI